MLDLLLRGGEVIDGSGAPRRRADVGVHAGRVVAIGEVDEPSRRTLDATGRIVAPGFVDPHTHYDAQVLWDGGLSPSPLHGVTTVVGGNCGFTVAPVSAASADYVTRMLARVEGMPVDTLVQALDFRWSTFGEWLDGLEGRIAVNAGFNVGHSTIRRLVMGDAAIGELATPDQLAAMVRIAHQSLAEGAIGFSTSRAGSHRDHHGDPVPSRYASRDEVLALCASVRDHEGTSLEIVPTAEFLFTDEDIQLMTAMSLAGRRTVNWNLLGVIGGEDKIRNKLASADHAAAAGARVVPLTLPDPQGLRLSFESGFVYDMLDGWGEVMALPHRAKRASLEDPDVRRRLERGAAGGAWWANWADTTIAEVFAPENARWEGRTVAAIAEERQVPLFDALCDLVLADDLRTGLVPRTVDDNEEGWRLRAELWRDPRVVIGGSDAGAHLDTIWTFNCISSLVGPSVRERKLIGLEDAVRLVTDVPARMYGLRDRGRIELGWHADLVVFDAGQLAPDPVRAVKDLPGGAWRLTGGARGIDHVIVNGVEIVRSGDYTGERPGMVLRSGRDTGTVPIPRDVVSGP
jgi:N-acyl-D-aspartate/D-glutamate deacylase